MLKICINLPDRLTYTRKSSAGREKNVGVRVIKDLLVPYKREKLKWIILLPAFGKISLPWDLIIVGTLTKTKPYIPLHRQPEKNNPLMTLAFMKK